MSYNPSDSALKKIEAIQQLLNDLNKEVAQESGGASSLIRYQIDSFPQLGQQLNARRKTLGIELSHLELQTGVSLSTLKRLFNDPAQVKFATVHQVAKTLGVTLCAVV
ncbi:helix-turn-helix transcriptional regulator [Erwinia sp. E_sp_B04_7]|uniref:helix-turn-helix domain-containing protein n=1 Tax=unclassified Erwinia TaxID=2622719 RepID=UPI0030CB341D